MLSNFVLFSAIHIIDLSTTRNSANFTLQHTMDVLQLALDHRGLASFRSLTVLDKSRNLYIVSVYSKEKKFLKLGMYF